MHAGFDYGTSHCSMGIVQDGAAGRGVRLVPLEDGQSLIPSTLYAPRPRDQLDAQAIDFSSEVLDGMKFGRAALDEYLLDPTEGFFIKSPKSFLGAQGLSFEVQERFIMVVAAMMANVKRHADALLDEPVDDVVIGRPINFQGAGGEAENTRALQMLVAAAREAGFVSVSFLYEPLAAAMAYEATLRDERLVLVLDIGGGTTDCSFVRVGPQRRAKTDRTDDVLAHAGERLGGNDYDQLIGLAALMPEFGYRKNLASGLPVPNVYFVDALSTNDVNAQQRFFSRPMKERLEQGIRDGRPELRRLRTVQDLRLTYRLVQSAEAAKIALTDAEAAQVDLGYVEAGLVARASRAQLRASCERLLAHIDDLLREVMRQGGRAPDLVYLTGGMAKSAVVRRYLEDALPAVALVDGDHFASVTEGLALWSERLYG